ncbi:MAG: 50S ribosomal protein L29 [bacterium]|nr:50S ribosomal protein L29 [bacterium]
MKKTDYKGKGRAELVKALMEKRESIRNARFGKAGSKTRNTKDIKNFKKEVARIMTELHVQNKK